MKDIATTSNLANFKFQKTDISKIKRLLNDTDVKKAVGIDSIATKFVKMSSYITAEPLITATSNCLT